MPKQDEKKRGKPVQGDAHRSVVVATRFTIQEKAAVWKVIKAHNANSSLAEMGRDELNVSQLLRREILGWAIKRSAELGMELTISNQEEAA